MACGISVMIFTVIHVYHSDSDITLMSNKRNPLPLENTLRDLAILRAADVDLSDLVTSTVESDEMSDEHKSVTQSYEFVKEARNAMKISHRDDVEKQGERIEELRSKLEQVIAGSEPQRK